MTAGASPPQSVSAGLVSARSFLLWRVAEGRAVIGGWRRRYRYRHELARLMRTGQHLIEDIGLLREHVEREVAKPLWRP